MDPLLAAEIPTDPNRNLTREEATLQHLRQQFIKRSIALRQVSGEVRMLREDINKTKASLKTFEQKLVAITLPGQMVGEVLREVDKEKYIVKGTSGTRYLVNARPAVHNNDTQLRNGARVALDMSTITIVRILPREVDPQVYNMQHMEDVSGEDGKVSFDQIGGVQDQMRSLREVVELPLTNPELFRRVGVAPPKGVLLYGPPGTGKTLLARAIASNVSAHFLKVSASSIVDKYIGESARVIREMFAFAREHEPCIIFIDEIDAIGSKRIEATSSDREIQRTLMELMNQLDGFDSLGKVKVLMATNRPDTLDPALLRPGRLDRKVEVPLPGPAARLDILRIHAAPLLTSGDIDYETVVKLSDGFNGADLRNVCTEAGMFAIRADRDHVLNEDVNKAVRKIAEAKKIEGNVQLYSD